VGVSYALYRYTGAGGSVDLGEEDFAGGSWEKITPDFDAEVHGVVSLSTGQVVLVRTESAYGMYVYAGQAGSVDLGSEEYGDSGRWRRMDADFRTSDGHVLLFTGAVVEDRNTLESVTLRLWNDVNVKAREDVTVETAGGIALEAPGALPVASVTAADSVRLKAAGALLDVSSDGAGTAVQTAGELVLVSEQEGIGTPEHPFFIDLAGEAPLSARAATDIYVSDPGDLYLEKAEAGGDISISSLGSMFDAVGTAEPNLVAGGLVQLSAEQGGIGTPDNDLDFQAGGTPSWRLHATAQLDAYLAGFGGSVVVDEGIIQVFSRVGDVRLTATDRGGVGDELIVRGTDTRGLESLTGFVILRGGDRVLVESDAPLHAARGVDIYVDDSAADPGVGGLVELRTSIQDVPVRIYGNNDDDEMVLTNVSYAGPGPAPSWTLDGREGSDRVTVNLGGSGRSEIGVYDTGTVGLDTLTLNGTDEDDTLLFRKGFVALLRPDGLDANQKPKYNPAFERVWYDGNMNGGLFVNSGQGADTLALDDNSTVTTLDTGEGDDTVQIGQIFRSIPPGMTEPEDVIQTTLGYLTNGVSFETMVCAGEGNDTLQVYRNQAPLALYGEAGDDAFLVRTFALAGTSIDAGAGADTIRYAVNAPVDILGGDGLDRVVVVGTEYSDAFVVTDTGVFGVGRATVYDGVELVTVDAYQGDDQIFVLSTNAAVGTVVMGSYGSDTIHVGGVPQGVSLEDIIVTPEPMSFTVTQTLGLIAGPLQIEGGTGAAQEARPIGDPVNMPGQGEGDPSFGPGEEVAGLNERESQDVLNVYNQQGTGRDQGWLEERTLTGLGMSSGAKIGGSDSPGGLVYGDMEEINIYLGPENDTFNIKSSHVGVTNLDTGDGDDTINVGSLASVMQGGVVDGLDGLLNIDAGVGFDRLHVDDTGDAEDNAGTLTGSSLTGLGMGQGLTYADIEALHVGLGSGNDTLNIQGTSVPTTVEGHDGDDTFNVSSDSPGNRGTLDFVAAELFIDAGAGVLNALEVSDQGDPDADAAVRITRDRIEGLAPATIHYQALGRFGRGVHVLTGTGDDQVRVESTLPADVTTLWLNKGNDRAVLSDADPGSPDGLVVVYGEDGDDTIDAASWSHGVIAFGDYGAVTYGSAEESRRSLRSAESRTTSTGGSDTLIGTDSDDLLVGGAGADSASLYGRGGNDILIGDSGKVTYSGGRVYQAQNTDFGIGGNDYLDGGEGHDILIGGAGSDTFVGNFSEDILIGEHGRVTLNSSGQATSVVRLGQGALDLITSSQFGLYSPIPLRQQVFELGEILPAERLTLYGPSVSGPGLEESFLAHSGALRPATAGPGRPEGYSPAEGYSEPEEAAPAPEQKSPETAQEGSAEESGEQKADTEESKEEAPHKETGSQESGPNQNPQEDKEAPQETPEAGEKKKTPSSELVSVVAGFTGWGLAKAAGSRRRNSRDLRVPEAPERGKGRFYRWMGGKWVDPDAAKGREDITHLPSRFIAHFRRLKGEEIKRPFH
ncbi:MAG: hypothetical protein JRF59_15880, partial [Deltaproteobacteria bacterium]|nr:hypothetical protein [Deltaproteobacteria bacterium]